MTGAAWDGGPLPAGDALRAALCDPAARPRLVRAAVVDAAFAAEVDGWVPALLADPDPQARGAALLLAQALCGRHHAARISAALRDDAAALVGIADPAQPGQTLALSALRYLVSIPGPRHRAARPGIQASLAHPELRVEAWRAMADDEPEAVLPHVAALLRAAPELADPVATRFALVHTAHVEAAAAEVAGLPEATRRAFGAALEKHLKRIFAVKRWVACRRILFGK